MFFRVHINACYIYEEILLLILMVIMLARCIIFKIKSRCSGFEHDDHDGVVDDLKPLRLLDKVGFIE